MRRLLPLALSLALALPAQAEDFTCEDGSSMHSIDGVEIIIKRPGEIAISLPYVGVTTEYTWWSPDMQSWGCTKAPCAIDFYQTGKPPVTYYMLDQDKQVTCRAK